MRRGGFVKSAHCSFKISHMFCPIFSLLLRRCSALPPSTCSVNQSLNRTLQVNLLDLNQNQHLFTSSIQRNSISIATAVVWALLRLDFVSKPIYYNGAWVDSETEGWLFNVLTRHLQLNWLDLSELTDPNEPNNSSVCVDSLLLFKMNAIWEFLNILI